MFFLNNTSTKLPSWARSRKTIEEDMDLKRSVRCGDSTSIQVFTYAIH